MFKKLSLLVCLMGLAVTANSQEVKLMNFDFVAPVVSAESTVPKQTGSIFYDIGAGFKGIDEDGNVDFLSNTLEAPDSAEYVTAVAYIQYSGGTPSVTRQSGTWIDSIDDDGTGLLTLQIATSSVFSVAPDCTATSNGTVKSIVFIDSSSTSEIEIRTSSNAGALQDTDFSIICMGPKN